MEGGECNMQNTQSIKKVIVSVALSVVLASSASVTSPLTVYAAKKVVYVAPESGKKYHCKKSCRGLSKANKIVSKTEKEAKKAGYTKCKICYKD